MSNSKQPKRRRSPVRQLTSLQVEKIKAVFDLALAAGDPTALLAVKLAQAQSIITLKGEPLTTTLPDTSVPLGGGQFLPRSADFLIRPDGAVVNIASETAPAQVMGGLTIHPSRLVRSKVRVNGLTCPKCGDTQAKEGWRFDALDEAGGVVNCPSCQMYLWYVAVPPTNEP